MADTFPRRLSGEKRRRKRRGWVGEDLGKVEKETEWLKLY